jgi:hypothetical protein
MAATPPRRVVNGHDASGRTVVLSDGPTPTTSTLETGAVFHEKWATAATPEPIAGAEPSEPTDRPFQVPPDTDGSFVLVIDMPPGSSAPMHRTKTIDYGIVLSGEVDLELDDGVELHLETGDLVVQRATAHAWYNRSERVARMLFVMVDGEITQELADSIGDEAIADILR